MVYLVMKQLLLISWVNVVNLRVRWNARKYQLLIYNDHFLLQVNQNLAYVYNYWIVIEQRNLKKEQ